MLTANTSIRSEIERTNDVFESYFEQGDAAAMARLYTSNGELLPTGMESIQGTSGIQAFWQGAMDMGIKQLKLRLPGKWRN